MRIREIQSGIREIRKLFPGKNIMTPDVLSYYKLRKGYAELSYGTGMRHQPIYGVTVKPDPDHAISKLCQSKDEAIGYIVSLS